MTTDAPDSAALLRGRAVEMFSELESSLDGIIAGYYTPRHPLSTYFQLDLLASENFGFSMRREVFECITRRHGWYDDQRMQHFRKAGRWRNFLAHACLELHDYGNDEPVPKVGIRDQKTGKAITVAEAFQNFTTECEKAIAYSREVSAKCFPMAPFCNVGHIVEEPVTHGAEWTAQLEAERKAQKP